MTKLRSNKTRLLTLIGIFYISIISIVCYFVFYISYSSQASSGSTEVQFNQLFVLILVITVLFLLLYYSLKHFLLRTNEGWQKQIKESNIDKLTGIPNQAQLLLDLEDKENPNLAFIKVLNYNHMINQYGPYIAEDVIKQIAIQLSNFTDDRLKGESIYRTQESTFAILENQKLDHEIISNITTNVVKSIVNRRYKVGEDNHIKVRVTVGAVSQKKDTFILANMALSEALERDLPFYFIAESNKNIPDSYRRDHQILSDLNLAINEDRLIPYYQPIFNSKTLEVEKYESLTRIVDSNQDCIYLPDEFLVLANRHNLYYKITRVMLTKSIEFATKNNVIVTINLGISDIINPQTRDFILNKVKSSKIGHLIHFEILENEALESYRQIYPFIKSLQAMKCQVGLDDLGKGHSNLERLLSLPVNFVKLDRSVMEQISKSKEMQKIVMGIIKLSHKNGLKVTAEYCCDSTITKLARMMNVDSLQGFYLAKPDKGLYQMKENVKLHLQ